MLVRAEDDRADAVFAKVEREREYGARATGTRHLEQLARHRAFQAVDARDPVADGGDHALVGVDHRRLEARDALFENLSDLVAAYSHQLVVPLSCLGKRCLQLLQMSAQAVVDDPVADADHEPADDGWIGAHGCLHVAAELLAQRFANVLLERRRRCGIAVMTSARRTPEALSASAS